MFDSRDQDRSLDLGLGPRDRVFKREPEEGKGINEGITRCRRREDPWF